MSSAIEAAPAPRTAHARRRSPSEPALARARRDRPADVHGHPRQPRDDERPARAARGVRGIRRGAAVVHERVHARLREHDPHGRRPRRPVRPAHAVPHRHRRLHAELGVRSPRRRPRPAHRRPGAAGLRRGRRSCRSRSRCSPAPCRSPGVRSRSASGAASPGSASRPGRSSAAPCSRAGPGRRSSGSTCPSASSRSRSPCSPCRTASAPGSAPTSSASCSRASACSALVYGIVRGNDAGWDSLEVLGSLIAGGILLAAFVAWECSHRGSAPAAAAVPRPQLHGGEPRRLRVQLRRVRLDLHPHPVPAGRAGRDSRSRRRCRPRRGRSRRWSSPRSPGSSPRVGTRALIVTGLLLLGGALFWLTALLDASVEYPAYVAPFIVAGIGMGLVFAPSATAVLATMAPDDHAKASGTNSMLREVGVALGIAVLTAIDYAVGGRAGGARRGRPCSWPPALVATLLPAGRRPQGGVGRHRRGGARRRGLRARRVCPCRCYAPDRNSRKRRAPPFPLRPSRERGVPRRPARSPQAQPPAAFDSR